MSKKKNRLNIQSVHPPKQVKKTPSRAAKKAAQAVSTPPQQKNTSKRRNVVTIASIALVVVIVAVVIFYIAAILPMQRIILTVGNDNIKTGYFIKRVVANPYGNINSTIQLLTAELIIKQEAATYGVAPVTEQAIDTYLREEANSSLSSGDTTTDSTATPTATPTLSDAEYDKWFDEQLANTGLSTKEYREIAGREIQRQRLTNILSADIPSTMPQVHLWAIVYSSNSAALAAKAKIDGGTDFAAVAVTAGQTNNGDQGWMPLVVLPTDLKTAASTLEVGKCSDPISYVQSSSSSSSGTTSYILLMISEKSDAMPLTADQLTILKNNGLTNWLNTQASNIKITFHGLHGSTTLDTQTSTWLDYQVQKLTKKRPSTETTSPVTIVPTTTTPSTATTSGTSP